MQYNQPRKFGRTSKCKYKKSVDETRNYRKSAEEEAVVRANHSRNEAGNKPIMRKLKCPKRKTAQDDETKTNAVRK